MVGSVAVDRDPEAWMGEMDFMLLEKRRRKPVLLLARQHTTVEVGERRKSLPW